MHPEISESEKRKMKKYFLETARKYEKNGLLREAATFYGTFWPQKARKVYLSFASKAERKRFFALAAEAYQAAGMIEKSRALWKLHGIECKKMGLDIIAQDAFKKSRPEDPKCEKRRELTRKASKFEKEGRFEEAQKQWMKVAKYNENTGFFEGAIRGYFNAGDLRNAKRVWHKLFEKRLEQKTK